jgi:hypothetical protein
MTKRFLVSLTLLPALLAAAPLMAQVGARGAVGTTRPATRPTTPLGASTAPAVVAPAVPIVLPKTFPALPADPIERAEFASKAKPITKSITSATAMMVVESLSGSELGVTADVIATVVAGSRQKDPLGDVLQSISAFANDPIVLKTHPEVKNLSDALKNKDVGVRDAAVRTTATALLRDQAFVTAHPTEAAVYRDRMLEAAQSQAVFVKKQAEVGPEMTTSFDEAVRAVGMRYPKWEPGKIEFSFGDKYTPHEGGSAGTCFAVMLLSELEGFEIDPKVAVTGDITVDWKVRKIGGLPAKVRGAAADKCLYTGVPLENRDQICDMALFYGDATLRDIQVFSLATLQDAVALMRKDRAPQLVEAMKEFTELRPKLQGGRGTFSIPANQKVLENILALAPNCESAKMMLEMAKGAFPRALTPLFAVDQLFTAIHPYDNVLSGKAPVTRQTISLAQTTAARKVLTQLAPIAPVELQPLVTDARAIVDVCENIALGQTKLDQLEIRRTNFITHYRALGTNQEFREKLMRSGM